MSNTVKVDLSDVRIMKAKDRGWVVCSFSDNFGVREDTISAHTTKADLISWLSRELEND